MFEELQICTMVKSRPRNQVSMIICLFSSVYENWYPWTIKESTVICLDSKYLDFFFLRKVIKGGKFGTQHVHIENLIGKTILNVFEGMRGLDGRVV